MGGVHARGRRESRRRTPAREALENLANILDNWQPLVALYEKALSAKGKERLPSALERELLLVVAVAYDEKLAQSDRAVEYFRRAQSIQPEDASALVALERLYTRTERWSDLVDTLLKKAQLVTDAAEREEIRIRTARVWEEMLGNAEQAIVAWNVVLQDNPGNVQALRALDRLYLTRGEFRELADNLQRQLKLVADDPAETVLLLGRLGALREQHLGQLGAAVDTYAKILQIEPEHARRSRRWSASCPAPSTSSTSRCCSSRSTRSAATGRSLIGVLRGRGAPHRRSARRRSRSTSRSPRATRSAWTIRRTPTRRSRARWPRIRRTPRCRRASSGWPARCGKLDDLVARYGQLVESVADPERKNALYHKIARLAEADLGDDVQAAAAYLAALDVWPRDLEAANALEQLYLRRADYHEPGQAAAAQGGDRRRRRREEDALLPRGAAPRRGDRRSRERRRRVPARAVRRRRRQGRARSAGAAVHPARALERPQEHLRQEGGAGRPRRPRRSRCCSCSGRSTTASSAIPERAVETYSSIMDLDPEDYDAAQALDRLYQQLGRWYDLLAVLERQTELAPSPAEVVSLRYRIGELWREHLKDLGRAVEAYRQVLAIDPAHEPTIRALEALMKGKDEPVLAAAVLEPIYESAGEWDRVIAVYEVMQAHSDDPVRDRRAAVVASPRSRSGGCRTRTRRSTSTARALRVDPNNQDVLAHLERLAAETGHWAKLANLLASEIEKVDEPRRAIDLLLRLARVYEEETGQLEEAIATYRRAIEADPDSKTALVALDRLFGRAQQWDELADVVRREIRIAPSRRGSHRADLPAGADLRAGAGRHAQGRRGLPRHPDRRPDARRDARGAGADVHGRHDAGRDRRRARAALPPARSGRSCTAISRGAARSADRRRPSGRRCCAAWRRSPSTSWSIRSRRSDGGRRRCKEDPSSEQALDELLRLARATHQWDAYVSDDDRAPRRPITRPPCGATCCCGWRRASRTTSATWNAPRTRWSRC